MNKIILGVLITLIFTSCSSKFSFQKRRYNKGVYISQSSINKLKSKAKEKNKDELALNANIDKELKQEKLETKNVEQVKTEPKNTPSPEEFVNNLEDKDVNAFAYTSCEQKKSSKKQSKKYTYELQLDTKSEFEYEKKSLIPFVNKSSVSKNIPMGWGSDWGIFGIIGIGLSVLVALVSIFYLLFIVFALVDNSAAALVIIGIGLAIAIVFAIILLINSD